MAPAAGARLGQEFRLAPPRPAPSAATSAVSAGEVARAARELATARPSRPNIDRSLLGNTADDDQADVMQERRGVPGRDTFEKPGKLEPSARGDSSPAVRAYGRPVDPVNVLGEALKSNDRGGRRNRDRDR
jgi:hypothetical protein